MNEPEKHDKTLVAFTPPHVGHVVYAVRCSCGWSSRHHHYQDDAMTEAFNHPPRPPSGRRGGPTLDVD